MSKTRPIADFVWSECNYNGRGNPLPWSISGASEHCFPTRTQVSQFFCCGELILNEGPSSGVLVWATECIFVHPVDRCMAGLNFRWLHTFFFFNQSISLNPHQPKLNDIIFVKAEFAGVSNVMANGYISENKAGKSHLFERGWAGLGLEKKIYKLTSEWKEGGRCFEMCETHRNVWWTISTQSAEEKLFTSFSMNSFAIGLVDENTVIAGWLRPWKWLDI